MSHEIVPTAPIVQSAISIGSLFSEAKAHHSDVSQHGHRSLASAKKCGELMLKAKEMVDDGEWLATVEKNWPNSARSIQVYIGIVKNWSKVQEARSIHEAIRWLTDDKKDKPLRKWRLCSRCKRLGAVAGCKACSKKNEPKPMVDKTAKPEEPKVEEKSAADRIAELEQEVAELKKAKPKKKSGQMSFDFGANTHARKRGVAEEGLEALRLLTTECLPELTGGEGETLNIGSDTLLILDALKNALDELLRRIPETG